jgi:hypothetical protein
VRSLSPTNASCSREKIVTAVVSAGIDLALWLSGEIAGRERAEAIQLTIEYDPYPPFDAGHMNRFIDLIHTGDRRFD